MTRKPEIAFGLVDEALTRVLQDVMRSLNLPAEVVDGVSQIRLQMLQHQDKLPKLCKTVITILEGSGSVEGKVKAMIESIGKILGQDLFSINLQWGTAEARLARIARERPDLYQALPAVIERGKAELRKLV